MLLKAEFFVVAAVAAVVTSFSGRYALHCLGETFDGGCGLVLAAALTAAATLSAMLCQLWHW